MGNCRTTDPLKYVDFVKKIYSQGDNFKGITFRGKF